jgi:hypothetical protein
LRSATHVVFGEHVENAGGCRQLEASVLGQLLLHLHLEALLLGPDAHPAKARCVLDEKEMKTERKEKEKRIRNEEGRPMVPF